MQGRRRIKTDSETRGRGGEREMGKVHAGLHAHQNNPRV